MMFARIKLMLRYLLSLMFGMPSKRFQVRYGLCVKIAHETLYLVDKDGKEYWTEIICNADQQDEEIYLNFPGNVAMHVFNLDALYQELLDWYKANSFSKEIQRECFGIKNPKRWETNHFHNSKNWFHKLQQSFE